MQVMKKYYLDNADGTKEIYVGQFATNIDFFTFYMENESSFVQQQNELDSDSTWHFKIV